MKSNVWLFGLHVSSALRSSCIQGTRDVWPSLSNRVSHTHIYIHVIYTVILQRHASITCKSVIAINNTNPKWVSSIHASNEAATSQSSGAFERSAIRAGVSRCAPCACSCSGDGPCPVRWPLRGLGRVRTKCSLAAATRSHGGRGR